MLRAPDFVCTSFRISRRRFRAASSLNGSNGGGAGAFGGGSEAHSFSRQALSWTSFGGGGAATRGPVSGDFATPGPLGPDRTDLGVRSTEAAPGISFTVAGCGATATASDGEGGGMANPKDSSSACPPTHPSSSLLSNRPLAADDSWPTRCTTHKTQAALLRQTATVWPSRSTAAWMSICDGPSRSLALNIVR